ncbi:MAG: glycine--tRNA ligase [Thaumarchaeota archaeon]|nr:glycine--tRNA ligase [Nitrososphaerota archaeon]
MKFEDAMRLAQQRGFFFKSAESYPNSPAGFWEYGPLGVSMRNKFVELWRREVVKRDGMLEIDGAQILPKGVFEASGHLSGFTDPFVKCGNCGSVFRPDKLIEEKSKRPVPEKLTDGEYDELMQKEGVKCTKCGSKLSGTGRFNMMFRVGVGPQQEEAYLRPETCQSIFVDFPLLFKTQRVKLPIGVAQVGKSFRNEIAPRQGLLRLRELNQAEVEVFFNPKKIDGKRFERAEEVVLNFVAPDGKKTTATVVGAVEQGLVPNALVGYYLALVNSFYARAGLPPDRVRFRMLAEEDRAFYSLGAFDLEVELSVGWVELVACNYRGDYDLSRHSRISGTDFSVDDEGEKVVPHIFELSLGVDRSLYALLETSMAVDGERRTLRLKPYLAPRTTGVFPLVNKDGLPELAEKIERSLKEDFDSFYDDSGSIGRRYARADEAGVPVCITVDYDSLKDNSVTLRSRDTSGQERVQISDLRGVIAGAISFPRLLLEG